MRGGRHRAGIDDLVTGNVVFNPGDTTARTAPDVMIIPGLRGHEFRSYRPSPGEAVPSVAVEIRSRSNTDGDIERRARLLLELGVGKLYARPACIGSNNGQGISIVHLASGLWATLADHERCEA